MAVWILRVGSLSAERAEVEHSIAAEDHARNTVCVVAGDEDVVDFRQRAAVPLAARNRQHSASLASRFVVGEILDRLVRQRRNGNSWRRNRYAVPEWHGLLSRQRQDEQTYA